MIYGSLCSGMEAATAAWHPLGWQPAFFSEIEVNPSRFLAAKYPTTPNHGDMTKFQEWPDHAIDLLVGGTPCQGFSIAGLRGGLDDDRSQLSLVYCQVARRYRPRWVAWENVPGVLSSDEGRDFGTFLGLLCGRRITAPKDGWGNAGIIPGIAGAYGLAWRVFDAQYVRVESHVFAVPQRRRRVFVVGYIGDWRRAAAVLLEREGLSGHPPPRRKAGQGFAADVAPGLTSSGRGVERAGETRGQDPIVAERGALAPISKCLNAGAMGRVDAESETLIPTIGGGFDVVHPLRAEGHDASEDGTGRGTPIVPVAFPARLSGTQVAAAHELSPSLGSANPMAVAYDMRGREGGAQFEGPHETANIRAGSGGSSRSYVAQQWAVRRLTPLECTRLQGFPDDYFECGLNRPLSDSVIYKMLGNSMAVNVMSWLGRRIALVDQIAGAAHE